MKHSKLFLPVILLLALTVNSFSQSLNDFSDVLGAKKIGKVFTKKAGQDISQRTYLGTVKDSVGKLKYHVIKEFLRIKAAIVYHGHSRILFFNENQKLTKQIILSLPNELPFKLKSNRLYFKYSTNGVKNIFLQNVSVLTGMICVKPKSCYDVSDP